MPKPGPIADEREPSPEGVDPTARPDLESPRPLREAPFDPTLRPGSSPSHGAGRAQAAEPLPSGRDERYVTRGEQGRGGNGRVLVAYDRSLGREIALKELIEPVEGQSQSIAGRFLREARLAGQLEHPNIVPVHDLGRDEAGGLYYTMRLVRGRTLSAVLGDCRSLEDRLRQLGTFWDLCNAVSFAHSRGVIHRDLKPHNVMVGEFGETVLLDWGLAKVRGQAEAEAEAPRAPAGDPADSGSTLHGTAVGTPSYMSPEQARGDLEAIDELSDVWGLGAVLYQILTGQTPFPGSGAAETMRAVLNDPLRRVASVCPAAPRELAAIAEKALQKPRERRYASARELAEDVGAYMTGGRVRAHRYSAWELLRRFAADHKAALGAALAILVVIVGALVALSVAWRGEQQARAQERVQRLNAQLQLARTYAERADRAMEGFRYTSASAFAARSLLHNPAHPTSPEHDPDFARGSPESAELRLRAASTAQQAGHRFVLEPVAAFPIGEVLGLSAFSPDGRTLATAAYDGTVRLWDVATLRPLHRLEADSRWAFAVAFSPSGELLASCGYDGRIALWDVASGRRLATLEGHQGLARAIAFSPDGRLLASGGIDATVRLWSVPERRALAAMGGHGAEIYALAFAPDGASVVTASADRTARVWDVDARRERGVLARFAGSVRSLALSPDGKRAVLATGERAFHVVDAATGEALLNFEGNERWVRHVAWSPDGRFIASGGFDATARLWDPASGEPVATLEGYGGVITGIAFSRDGEHLATSCYDGTLRLFRLGPPKLPRLAADASILYALAYSPDGKRLATSSWDRTVRVWDLATGRALFAVKSGARPERSLSFSPDGRWLVSAAKDLELFDAESGAVRLKLPVRDASTATFSPDGLLLAAGLDSGRIQLWDAASGWLVRELPGHPDMVFGLEFSRDGALLASSGKDGVVRLWDPATGGGRGELRGHTDWAWEVAFARDGRLASSGKDGQLILWDPVQRAELLRLPHPKRWIHAARFSPDGELLVTASEDQRVRIFDSRTGRPLAMLKSTLETGGLDLAPDGRSYALAEGSGAVIYPVDTSALEVDPAAVLERARRLGFEDPDAPPGR